MNDAIRRGWSDLMDFILPRLCCGCGQRILQYRLLVCEECTRQIAPLLEPICIRCGCPDARVLGPDKCANCPPGQIAFTRARGVAEYSKTAQVLVHRLKYHLRPEYADVLARAMVAAYCREGDSTRCDVVVPVPLYSARHRQRGFNQAALLGAFIAKALGIKHSRNALVRTRPTISQTKLKIRHRRKNVEGAFACKLPQDIIGKRVLLVDDVYTTGSTINECAKVLMKAGAESVECLAYARAVLSAS